MSNIGLSFGILSSVKEIYEHADWECLPANLAIQHSKIWKKKLFRDLGEGYYQAQVDLRDSLQQVVEDVIIVYIIIDQRRCTNSMQYAAYLLDNHSRGDYAQKYNVAGKLDNNVGEKILNMFLDLTNC